MEIKELRIGNLVKWGIHECLIKGIHTDTITGKDPYVYGSVMIGAMPIYKIEGIELTPEWLTKLGWGKSEEHEMGHNAYEPWGFYYDYHFKRFRIENSETDWDVEMPNIKYLHQVQNVIFSLTGEELAIDKTSLI